MSSFGRRTEPLFVVKDGVVYNKKVYDFLRRQSINTFKDKS